MSSNLKDPDRHDTRNQILDVANGLFRIYGPGKTTMAEIADAADMSSANIYRYFENKHDLVEECIWQIMLLRLNELCKIVQQPKMSAVTRLREFMLTTLRQAYEGREQAPQLEALIEFASCHYSKLILCKAEQEQLLISEILLQGKSRGEFSVDDPAVTATAIHDAISPFETSCFIGRYSINQLEDMVNDMIDLLLKALQAHKHNNGEARESI